MFNTSARSAMDDLPAPREREPVAGPWFMYSVKTDAGDVLLKGIAREISVTEAGFRRFFEIEDDVDDISAWWRIINSKLSETCSAVGKVFKAYGNKPTRYQILFIDHSHGALMGHSVRTTISKETGICN